SLHRQPADVEAPAFRALHLAAGIRNVQRLARIAGVQVGIDAGDGSILPFVADRAVVPETILLDRTADAERVVPLLQQLARRGEAGRPQRVAVVAADHPFADTGKIGGAADAVA